MKKRVTFVYPGSKWARLSGCYVNGCYAVVIHSSENEKVRLIRGGFPSLEGAIAYADRLPYPYHKHTLKEKINV